MKWEMLHTFDYGLKKLLSLQNFIPCIRNINGGYFVKVSKLWAEVNHNKWQGRLFK